MRKHIIAFVITALAVVFGNLALVAPAANAEVTAPEECLTTGSASNTEVKMEACAYTEQSQSVNVTLTDRATASGKIQLSYFNPNAAAWSLAKAKKCKQIYVSIKWSKAKIKRVVKNNKRKVNGTWCVRLKHGSTWANSGKNGNIVVPFTATVRGSWSLMTLKNVRKGIWGHKGEYRGGRFWQVCDNEWKIGLRPTLKDTQVLMVRSEADVVYRNTTVMTTSGKVEVKGSLVCPTGTLYGSASASAGATTTETIFVKASSSASARIEAARRAYANTTAWAQLRINAQKSQEVSVHASIHLVCEEAPDSPPTLEGHAPQHLYVGEDAQFADFDAFDPDGDPITFTHEVLNANGQPFTGDDASPIAITLVERSVVNGKQRLTIGIRPLNNVPEGTSKLAQLKVTASAGGKSVSFTATIEVVNDNTGW